ncbi:DUF4292 domain-containing protein [Pontibacter harenae]|uniref:DUF4292 domain-containing protein n=1 Tax=Pontibacter harenae TaxID=2894083 RepID=UPI001E41E3C6|nr:DUF4292 domain-containing protein [Pontibacter harenae]MCC9166674.1 DUF4292 domain-containing protein [Pontibacter harenae]
MRSKNILLCLLSLLAFASCKKDTVPTTATATTETVGRVSVKNLEFNYLTTRGQLKLEDKNGTTSSGYALRVKKDSIIWISVLPGLGFEAARIKITTDSIYVMDRLHKEYLATDYSFLRNKFHVDMDYNVLQAILLGNYQPAGAEKVMDEADLHHIQQARENLLFDYFVGRQSSKLQQLNVQDKNTGNTITVKYDSFQSVGETPFAYALAAQVLQQGQSSNFSLTHNRVTVNDEALEFPFNVPSDYKRINFN